MSHYECSRCGRYPCVPSTCSAEDARKEERLVELGLTKEDLALLKRAVHVIELTLPETSYAKGIILAELLEDIKKRIK